MYHISQLSHFQYFSKINLFLFQKGTPQTCSLTAIFIFRLILIQIKYAYFSHLLARISIHHLSS